MSIGGYTDWFVLMVEIILSLALRRRFLDKQKQWLWFFCAMHP